MSSSSRQTEVERLHTAGADLAVLDIPTGRILLTRGHNDIIGSVDELRALARTLLAACEQVAGIDQPDRWQLDAEET